MRLGFRQVEMLAVIEHDGPNLQATQVDLEHIVGIDQSHVYRICKQLEGLGLVTVVRKRTKPGHEGWLPNLYSITDEGSVLLKTGVNSVS